MLNFYRREGVNSKSLERASTANIKAGTTSSRLSFLEAKKSDIDMRVYKDNTGKKHIVYLMTKPTTYFSFEYPPQTLHQYYDEWGWPRATANNLNTSDSPKNNNNPSTPEPNRPETPDPGYGGAKKTRKRSKRKTRKSRKSKV